MGSSNSKPNEQLNFDVKDWVPENDIIPQENNNFMTLKNIHTGELIDKYHIDMPSENDYNFYVESLKWRKNQPFIVKVFHYDTHQRRQFCSSTYSVTAYLNHVRGRLSQFKDIPFPDNLYCIMAMLEGYKKLYDKIGRFYVCEEQVCIDEEGEIRVWLNSDLSKNFPQIQHFEQDGFRDEESAMVDEIIEMVISNTDQTEEPEVKFGDFYQRQKENRHNQIRFEEGKAIVNDYARFTNVQIPDLFQSVLQMYKMSDKDPNQQFDFLPNQPHHHNPDIPNMNIPIHQQHPSPNKLQQIPEQHQIQQRHYVQHQPQISNPNRQIIHPQPIPNQPRTIQYQPIPHQYSQLPLPSSQINRVQFQFPPPPFEQKIVQPEFKLRQGINVQPIPSHNVSGVHTTQIVTPQFFSPHQKQINPIQFKPDITKPNLVEEIPITKLAFKKEEQPVEHNYQNHFQNTEHYEEEEEPYYREEEFNREEEEEEEQEDDYQHQQQEEDALFNSANEERKITQSQAYKIQESQHSAGTSNHAKYSAPASQIYQYQSLSNMSHNKANISKLSSLSNPPKKARLQYYYTVEEQQELDPEIAADLLLYT